MMEPAATVLLAAFYVAIAGFTAWAYLTRRYRRLAAFGVLFALLTAYFFSG